MGIYFFKILHCSYEFRVKMCVIKCTYILNVSTEYDIKVCITDDNEITAFKQLTYFYNRN